MQHAIDIFRIKWVWIRLRLSGTRVPSRGAFFGRIDDPRFQKKKLFTSYTPDIEIIKHSKSFRIQELPENTDYKLPVQGEAEVQ